MTKFSEDVHPLSELSKNAGDLVRQTRRSGRPVLLTQRGKAAAVLVSVDQWEREQERRELLEAILRGERDFAEGRVVEEDEALARIRASARKREPRR